MKALKLLSIIMALLLSATFISACVNIPFADESSAVPAYVNSNEESHSPVSEPSSDEPSPEESIVISTEPSIEESSEPIVESSIEESSIEESSEPISVDPIEIPEEIKYYMDMVIGESEYDSYFNDSVFVGHSVMVHYLNYTTATRRRVPSYLGTAKFFCASSFGLNNNNTKAVLPKYKDVSYTIEEAVDVMGVKRAFISLMALNDIALFAVDKGARETFNLLVDVIENIQRDNPEVEIVILSNTYLNYRTNTWQKLNNGSISDLNILTLEYCNNNNIDFIDLSTVLLDDKDCLADEFCKDYEGEDARGCHLTNYAYNAWTQILREYSRLKQAGAWVNPSEMAKLYKNS